MDEIVIIGSFNQNKNCIFIDGQGQGQMNLIFDATQLAPLLTAFAKFKEQQIEIRLKPLMGDCKNGRQKTAEVIR